MANRTKALETKQKLGTLRPDRVPANVIKPHHLREIPLPPKKYKNIPEGKKKFKQICQYLLNENRLIQPDVEQIELLTDAFIMYDEAWEQITDLREKALFVKSQYNQGGQEYETLTQWWSVFKTSQEMIRKISNDLGLTPAARNKVGLPAGDRDTNAAQKLRDALLSNARIN